MITVNQRFLLNIDNMMMVKSIRNVRNGIGMSTVNIIIKNVYIIKDNENDKIFNYVILYNLVNNNNLQLL